jgi:hypothetical protein
MPRAAPSDLPARPAPSARSTHPAPGARSTHPAPGARSVPSARSASSEDDDQLRGLLMTVWALTSGRRPPDRPVEQLDAGELIAFWADDLTAGEPPQE